MKLIKIAIKRTIVTTMISISLLILGIFAMRSMRTELYRISCCKNYNSLVWSFC